MTSSIPTVDLTPFVGECGGCVIGDKPTPAQLACASSIADACREHGFMRVRNLGFPQERVRDMFASTASLFAMSEADKTSKLNPYDPARNTGYSAFATEALNAVRPPDLKEAFNIRCRKHFDNDYRGAPPGFGEMAESMWDDLEIVSRRLFLACALALDLPRDDLGFFERTFKRMDQCTLRFLHFPPCKYAAGAQDDVDATLRIGEHVDFGMITLLFHDGEAAGEGLQVKKAEMGAVGGKAGGEKGGWRDVVVEGSRGNDSGENASAIVNTGALLARWTSDEWKATAHRVIVPNAECASKHRYSCAFFLDPDCDEIVATHPARLVALNEEAKYEPISSKAFVQMKIQEMQTAKQKGARGYT